METSYMNKITGFVIALVLGAILVGGMLAPTVVGIQEDISNMGRVEYSNAELSPYSYGKIYEFSETDTEDTVIISICKTGEKTLSINGVSHNIAAWQPVVLSDGFTIRYYSLNMSLITPTAGNKTITEATITISGGIATFSGVLNGETEITIDPEPITWAFVHDMQGKYGGVITENGVTVYAHKNEIYASNWINTTSEYFSSKAGMDHVILGAANSTETTPINWGGEYLNNGVYKLTLNSTSDDYTFVVDNAGEDYTVHPFLVVVPKTVSGIPDNQQVINEQYQVMFGILTLLAIVMLVVVAANAIRNKY